MWTRMIGGVSVDALLATNGQLFFSAQPRGPQPIAKGSTPGLNALVARLDGNGGLVGRFGGVLVWSGLPGPVKIGDQTLAPKAMSADLLIRLP